jgi:hypothetical protein
MKGIVMKPSLYKKVAVFNLAASILFGLACMGVVASAIAQSGPTGPTPPPYTPQISVTPAVATAGVERRITVSGIWPNGCIPQGVTPLSEATRFTRVLPLRLEIPLTLVACLAALTPYSYTISYTPQSVGDHRLVVFGNDGVTSNEILMSIASADATRSLYNATGMWYDPVTSGSGLVFVHNFTTTDILFGAWFMYDQTGAARWYSIQDGKWLNSTEYVGTLYETSASAGQCGANPVCPARFSSLRRVGSVNVNMTGRETMTVRALTTNGAATLFTSFLIRGL